MEAKYVLPMRSLSSASITDIGHCSALVAAFTGFKSMVVLNMNIEAFGTKYGAACHAAYRQGLRKPMSTSFGKYTSKKFLCSAGYFLTLPSTGLLDSSRTIFIGLTFAGSTLPTLILNPN